MGLQVPIFFCWRTILGWAVCDYHALKMGTHSRSAEFCLCSNIYSVLTWKARVTFPRVHSGTFASLTPLGSNIGPITQLSTWHGSILGTHPLCGHFGPLPKQWEIWPNPAAHEQVYVVGTTKYYQLKNPQWHNSRQFSFRASTTYSRSTNSSTTISRSTKQHLFYFQRQFKHPNPPTSIFQPSSDFDFRQIHGKLLP